MSDGTLCRLAPHAAGDDHALLPAWPTPARALPVPPELPADLSVALARQLEESWPRLSCTAVGEDGWVASGDSTGRIRLWRAENGASGGELGFRHGVERRQRQALPTEEEAAAAQEEAAAAAADPATVAGWRRELVEKQATLALLESEGRRRRVGVRRHR